MSNPVLQAIADRRSIRAYTSEQITKEQLDALLNAAMEAPSARNLQPFHITVVQNPALLTRINELYREQMLKTCPPEMRERVEDPSYSVFHHAPTLLVFSCPPLSEMAYAQTDTGIAIQTVALAAHSLGLGSVILGMPRMAFMGPEGDALRAELRFPEGYDFCLAIAIGHPAGTKEPHPQAAGLIDIIE